MKIKNAIYFFIIIIFTFIACNGSSTGNQYDQNAILNDNSENSIIPGNSGAASGGSDGEEGNEEEDSDDSGNDTSKEICGVFDKTTKIINGVTCPDKNSPVMKILIYTATSRYLCSGTLIDSNVVLTAGHCFKDFSSDERVEKVEVVSGGKVLEVSNYVVQDGYSPERGVDLAIIKLKNKVSNIAPVAIVTSKIPAVNSSFMIYGYGKNENGVAGNLVAAYMKVKGVDSLWLSAAYDDTKTNTCNGDSGGPAVIKVNGIVGVVGVTSFGVAETCFTGDISYFPILSNNKNLTFIKKYASISTL